MRNDGDLREDEAVVPSFRSRWVDTPAGRMHAIDEGEGDAVLFVHGTPTWSFEWRHVIRALSGEWRCVAPDHLGFGHSDRPRDFAYGPEAHAHQLDAFVRGIGLERFDLVVHDFGGPIGLPLVLRDPGRIGRLVLINTWMWSFAGDAAMERPARLAGSSLGRFLYRHLDFSLRVMLPRGYADRRRLTREVHEVYRSRFRDGWSREAVLWSLAKSLMGSSAFFDSLWRQRHVLRDVETMVVWGMRDFAFGPAQLERWREALPSARVVEVPDAGHWPHEEQPEAVVSALREFL